MAESKMTGTFSDFLETSGNQIFKNAFPNFNKMMDRAMNFDKEKEEEKEEKKEEKKATAEENDDDDDDDDNSKIKKSRGFRNEKGDFDIKVLDALGDLHEDNKLIKMVLESSFVEHYESTQLLRRLLNNSGSGGSGSSAVAGGTGGGVLDTSVKAAEIGIGVASIAEMVPALAGLAAILPEIIAGMAVIGGASVLGYGVYKVFKTKTPEEKAELKKSKIDDDIEIIDAEINSRKQFIEKNKSKTTDHTLSDKERQTAIYEEAKQQTLINQLETEKLKLLESQSDTLKDQLELQKENNKELNKKKENVSSDDTLTELKKEAKEEETDDLAKVTASGMTPSVFANAQAALGFGTPLSGGKDATSLGNRGLLGDAKPGSMPGGNNGNAVFTNPIGDGHPGSEVGKMTGLHADDPNDRVKIDAYMKEGGVTGTAEGEMWCADWVNAQLAHEGIKGGTPSAASFNNWGTATSGQEAKIGDVMVRSDSGHVGRYTGNKRKRPDGTWEYEMSAGNETIRGGPYNTTPGRQPGHNGYGKVNTYYVPEGQYRFRAMPVRDGNSRDGVKISSSNTNSSPTQPSQKTSYIGQNNLPAGMRNNNPINLKHTPTSHSTWSEYGYVGPSQNTDEGTPQVIFDSNEHGLQAGAKQIEMYGKRGVNKIRSFIRSFSPGMPSAADNIATSLGISADAKVDFTDSDFQKKFLKALIKQEQGLSGGKYSDKMINEAVDSLHTKSNNNNNNNNNTPKIKVSKPSEGADHRVTNDAAYGSSALSKIKRENPVAKELADNSKKREVNNTTPRETTPSPHASTHHNITTSKVKEGDNSKKKDMKVSATPSTSRLIQLFTTPVNNQYKV